jgi:hypothetical protein
MGKYTHIIPISLDTLGQDIGPSINDRRLQRGLYDGWDRHIEARERSSRPLFVRL